MLTRSSAPSPLLERPDSAESFLSAMDDDRVVRMEQAVDQLRSETQSTLDQILITIARLSQSLLETNPPPTSSQQPASPPPADHHHTCTARPAVPPDFDGDRTKGKAFLNTCLTYFRLCPKEFLDEQMKIVWAMSYMKSGRAQKWTDRAFQWEQQNSGTTKFL